MGRPSPMLLAFFQRERNGRRTIGHEGDTQTFHSVLRLFIDDSVGVYASMNSTGKEGAADLIRTALIEQFADRYFPAPPQANDAIDARTAAEHARVMRGVYEPSRGARSSFLSLVFFLGQAKVETSGDSAIRVAAIQGLNGQPKQWREVAPYVWREVGGEERLAARVENGRVTMFSVDAVSPFMVFLPVPWWKSSAWLVPLLVAGLTAMVLTLVAWPAGAIIRRRHGAAFALSGTPARARQFMRVAILANVGMLIAWAATLIPSATDLSVFSSRLDPWIWALHIASAIVFVGAAVGALWNTWVTWTTRRSWFAKAWSAALAVACLTVLWIAVSFKLIAFNANF